MTWGEFCSVLRGHLCWDLSLILRKHEAVCPFYCVVAVTETTPTPQSAAVSSVFNISNWKSSDVQTWLKKNKLDHLQIW